MSDFRLDARFPHLLPLCTLRRTPPPISLLSRFKTLCVLLRAFKACFLIPACKCNRAEVPLHVWAVCRVSPSFSPTFTLERQQSLEVQSVRARQSAKVKALGNRIFCGKCLEERGLEKLHLL